MCSFCAFLPGAQPGREETTLPTSLLGDCIDIDFTSHSRLDRTTTLLVACGFAIHTVSTFLRMWVYLLRPYVYQFYPGIHVASTLASIPMVVRSEHSCGFDIGLLIDTRIRSWHQPGLCKWLDLLCYVSSKDRS
eukprot:c23625_g11_i2 orf=163-564(+)